MLGFNSRTQNGEKTSQANASLSKKITRQAKEPVSEGTSLLGRTGYQSLGSLQSFLTKNWNENEIPKSIEEIQRFSLLSKRKVQGEKNKKKETSGSPFFDESAGLKEEKAMNPIKVLLNEDSQEKRVAAAKKITEGIIKELGAEFLIEGEDKRAQNAFDLEERFVNRFKNKMMEEKLDLYQKLLEMISVPKPKMASRVKSLLRKQYKSEAEKDRENLEDLVQEYWAFNKFENEGTNSPKSQNSQASSLRLLRQQSSISQSNSSSGIKALGQSASGVINYQNLHGKSTSSKIFQPVDEVLGSLDSEGDKNVRAFFHIHPSLKSVWEEVVKYGESEMIENIFQVADVFSGHSVQEAHEMQANGPPIAKECLELVESSTWDQDSSVKLVLISDEKGFKLSNVHLRPEPRVALVKDLKISPKFLSLSLNNVRFSEMDLLYLGARMSHSASQLQKIKLKKIGMSEHCHAIFRELLSKIPLQNLTMKNCEITSKEFALYNEKLAMLPIKFVSFPFNRIGKTPFKLLNAPFERYQMTMES